jgi:signal transduction histidine kinase
MQIVHNTSLSHPIPPFIWFRLTGAGTRIVRSEGKDGHVCLIGSRLGLSIATNKIATAYGGTISISANLDGRGLGVTVRFHAWQHNEI